MYFCFIVYTKAIFASYSRSFLTSYFCIPVLYNEKEIGGRGSSSKRSCREFQKNIYFCFIDYAKAFDCVDHNKLWKILKEMGIQDHLRNLYAGQEATVKTGRGTTDWFQIGKGVYCHPAYLTYMQSTS